MRSTSLVFYYEFASPYSYLSAVRIAPLASALGVDVQWTPFLLGPIFADQGYTTSPFNVFPLKGNYMWRDLTRLAALQKLPQMCRPDPFPVNALFAARVATALEGAERRDFSIAVFKAEFAEGRDINDPSVVRRIIADQGHDAHEVAVRAEEPAIKDRLRAATQCAAAAGIFGAPSFVTRDGDLFWGNDRLEQALAHAMRLDLVA